MPARNLILIAGLALSAPAPAAPALTLTHVPPYGSEENLAGRAEDVVFADHRVAAYVFIGGWWTKPTFAGAQTPIQPDGSWTCDITTGGSDRYATKVAAFLVPASFPPPQAAGALELPAELYANAVARVIVTRPYTRRLWLSGLEWSVKDSGGGPVGPGPNVFSDDPGNVWVDAGGRLHLKIVKRNGVWTCAEVVSVRSFGHGTYRVFLDSEADALDPNAVLGLFTWNDDGAYTHREIDVEISRWGNAADLNNAQFVVQPWDSPGHLTRFRVPPGQIQSTHCFNWKSNRVDFASYAGHHAPAPAVNSEIAAWSRPGADTPAAGGENFRLNLWLLNGQAPADGLDEEVIIPRFAFIPPVLPASVITNASVSATGLVDIHATAEPGLTYRARASADLTAWSDLSDRIAPTNSVHFPALSAPGTPRFFQVQTPEQ